MRNHHEPNEKSIQHVILETTGLADPTPILQLITQGANRKGNDDIVQNYYLNGIITLVDAKHFFQTLSSLPKTNEEFKNEMIAQLLTTDCIILNKTDLLTNQEQDIKAMQQFIHQYNPTAKLIQTSFASNIQPHDIFDLRMEGDPNPLQTNAIEQALKKHDPSIEQTMLIASGGYVDRVSVQQFIKNTITNNHAIYRIKGILYLKENPDIKFIVQGVAQDQLQILEGNRWDPDEARESRLTLIGKLLLAQYKQLEDQFKKCIL